MQVTPRRTIHYTEIEIPPPDHPLYQEWQTWLREMPRMLAEGYEGQYVVYHEDTILGPFSEFPEARAAGYERYGFQTRFMIRQIFEQEPVIYSRYPVVNHA